MIFFNLYNKKQTKTGTYLPKLLVTSAIAVSSIEYVNTQSRFEEEKF